MQETRDCSVDTSHIPRPVQTRHHAAAVTPGNVEPDASADERVEECAHVAARAVLKTVIRLTGRLLLRTEKNGNRNLGSDIECGGHKIFDGLGDFKLCSGDLA